MELHVLRLDFDLPLPRTAVEGDAGLDLYTREAVLLSANAGRAVVPPGVADEIAAGHAGLVLPRSGLAAQNGVTVLNAHSSDCGHPVRVESGHRSG